MEGVETKVRVLMVADVPPSRDPVLGDGSTLILHDLLEHRPASWAVTLVGPGAVAVPGVVSEPLRDEGWPRWRSLAARAWLGAGAAFVGPAALARIRALAAASDVVYLHGAATLRLVPLLADLGPVMVNPIDIWSNHHRLAAGRADGRRAALSARIRSARMARLERAAAASATQVVLVSADERDLWARTYGGAPVAAVPNGLARTDGGWAGLASSTVLFVGTLDYEPNIDSATTLARDVMPRLRVAVPGVRLQLVGRRPAPEVLALRATDIEVLSNVPAVEPYYRAAALALFPGELGTGIRNCVMEALAEGCPVVASSHSTRGLPPGDHVIVADDDVAMAATTVALLLDRDRLAAAAAAAARFGLALPEPKEMAASYAALLEAAAGPAAAGGGAA